MDGDAQRFLLPNQHHQFFATSDARINEVALEQHVVLRGERNHHRWKFRSLRFVDRDRIRRGNFVQFPEIVFHYPVIEANRNLMFHYIYPFDRSDIVGNCRQMMAALRGEQANVGA